jgi:predicted secreted Zn-dependent protease
VAREPGSTTPVTGTLVVREMRAIGLALALLLLAGCGHEERTGDATPRSPAIAATTTDEQELPARANPRVVVRTRLRPYDVAGTSADELRAAMERLGPKDRVSGTPYAGFTRWRIEWSYNYARAAACAVTGVRVVARIQITLPRWRRTRRADPSLAAEWKRFVAALRRHEDGHAAIARSAARRIARRLRLLGTFRSCARLERAADAAGARILEEARAAETAYDERTRHGDTQGARFPS